MPDPNLAILTVGSPVRGSAAGGPDQQFYAASVSLSWSWGLQPATAMVQFAGATESLAFLPWSRITIELGGHTFYGLARSSVPSLRATGGHDNTMEFQDMRVLLDYDPVFGAFNLRELRVVTQADGTHRVQRLYKHLRPRDVAANRWTYTEAPVSADDVLRDLFDAPTVKTAWGWQYLRRAGTAALNPVYGLDFTSGPKLGQALLQVAEKLGLTFTLAGGPYNLLFCLKGDGVVPAFPENSDQRRSGIAVSGNGTRITVVGGRNTYLVQGITLVPDWKAGWENFWHPDLLGFFIYDYFTIREGEAGKAPGGTEYPEGTAYNAIVPKERGAMLAMCRAQRITVAEFIEGLRAVAGKPWNVDTDFADYRKFRGQSRMQMLAYLYVNQILFRAFRVPDTFTFKNAVGETVPMLGARIAEASPLSVTLDDPVSGTFRVDTESEDPAHAPGLVIARCFDVGQNVYQLLRSGKFDIERFKQTDTLWTPIPFHLEEAGDNCPQTIYSDRPVWVSSTSLVPARTRTGRTQANTAVLSQTPTFTVPPMKACLAFEAERFSYSRGDDGKEDVVTEPQLAGEFYCPSATALPAFEVPYLDGLTCTEKADQLCQMLLSRPYAYDYGGYVVQGSNATQLSEVIDRVTVRYDAGGIEETVDWTTERSRYMDSRGRMMLEPDREYERKRQLQLTIPGQHELKEEARRLQLVAAGTFGASATEFRKNVKEMWDALMQDHPTGPLLIPTNSPPEELYPGTPIWTEAVNAGELETTPTPPGATYEFTAPVFCGVTVFQDCWTGGMSHVARNGTVMARVKGPADAGDVVGLPSGTLVRDYLNTDSVVSVGEVQQHVPDDGEVWFVPVKTSGSGGGSEIEVVLCNPVTGEERVAWVKGRWEAET